MRAETLRDKLGDHLKTVLANRSHPYGWPILPKPDRIDRLLQPREADLLASLMNKVGGTFDRIEGGRVLSLAMRPHDGFADQHWRPGEPVAITYWRRPRIWRSAIGTWMHRGVLGLLRHIYRLRAPDGEKDFDRKIYAALGVAALGLIAELAKEPVGSDGLTSA